MPLSLLHPIFGEFVDDAENYVPTLNDGPFLLEFVEAMVDVYKAENERRETVLNIFRKYNMHINPTSIGEYRTDGDLSSGKFRYLIFEFKNEIGATGAEPFFQGILYYLEGTRKFASQHRNSVLPCIIVLIFGALSFLDPSFIYLIYSGPYIAFAGAAWTDRPTIQMLSSAIPCHYQDTDIKMESMLVRHLGALRRAMRSLDTYYQEYSANPSLPLRNPTHPYPTTFTSRDGSVIRFIYHSQMKGRNRNLFFGRMDGPDGTAICIKFVTRYCEEGHELLAAKGFAPKLHAVERLPGGLYMVVMDDVSVEYVSLSDLIQDNLDLLLEEHLGARNSLSDKIRQCLRQLHQAGFVHGDIRDTNIMVKRGGFNDGFFLVVDYDSGGKIKQVRYPLTLNTISVQRPEGATGGAIIEVEHDLKMLDHIWDS